VGKFDGEFLIGIYDQDPCLDTSACRLRIGAFTRLSDHAQKKEHERKNE
jgi:hypothetical protein